jgi:hypothetical protein
MSTPPHAPPQPDLPSLGARFQLTELVERFPHFNVPSGATGTIVESRPDLIHLHLDRYVKGAEDWNNDLALTAEDDYQPSGEPTCTPHAARALYTQAIPFVEDTIPPQAQTPAEADAEAFKRPRDGIRLVTFANADTAGVEVYLPGKMLGYACYHTPQPGADGLAGAAYWSAQTLHGRVLNRASHPGGIEPGVTATTGQATREQAIGLLLAADTLGLC